MDSDSTLPAELRSLAFKDASYVDAERDYVITATNAARTAWFLCEAATDAATARSPTKTLSDVATLGVVAYASNPAKQSGHARMARVIAKANGIESFAVTYVQVPPDGVRDALRRKRVDAVFVMCNDEEFRALRSDSTVSSIDYAASWDADIMVAFAPYAYVHTAYMSDWFPKTTFSTFDKIRQVATFDTALTCSRSACSASATLVASALQRYRKTLSDQRALTLRLARFFRLHPMTERVASSSVGEHVHVDEPAIAPTIDVTDGTVVLHGLQGSWEVTRWHVFDVFSCTNLDLLPWKLQLGTTVVKAPEMRELFVLPGHKLATRVPATSTPGATGWTRAYMATRDGSGTVLTLSRDEVSCPIRMRPKMAIAWFPNATTSIDIELPLEAFVVSESLSSLRLSVPPQTALHLVQEWERQRPPQCVNFPDVATRADCLARGSVWDRPCKYDSECPFYLVNKGDTRGGCNGGYCEMPVGMRSKGHRYYVLDNTSYPVCKGCDIDNTYDASCCQEILFSQTT